MMYVLALLPATVLTMDDSGYSIHLTIAFPHPSPTIRCKDVVPSLANSLRGAAKAQMMRSRRFHASKSIRGKSPARKTQ